MVTFMGIMLVAWLATKKQVVDLAYRAKRQDPPSLDELRERNAAKRNRPNRKRGPVRTWWDRWTDNALTTHAEKSRIKTEGKLAAYREAEPFLTEEVKRKQLAKLKRRQTRLDSAFGQRRAGLAAVSDGAGGVITIPSDQSKTERGRAGIPDKKEKPTGEDAAAAPSAAGTGDSSTDNDTNGERVATGPEAAATPEAVEKRTRERAGTPPDFSQSKKNLDKLIEETAAETEAWERNIRMDEDAAAAEALRREAREIRAEEDRKATRAAFEEIAKTVRDDILRRDKEEKEHLRKLAEEQQKKREDEERQARKRATEQQQAREKQQPPTPVVQAEAERMDVTEPAQIEQAPATNNEGTSVGDITYTEAANELDAVEQAGVELHSKLVALIDGLSARQWGSGVTGPLTTVEEMLSDANLLVREEADEIEAGGKEVADAWADADDIPDKHTALAV